MAITMQINNNLNKAKELIESCGFLNSGESVTVTTEDASTVLSIYDTDDNIVFKLTYSDRAKPYAYANTSTSKTFTTNNSNSIVDGIGCCNGVIIRLRFGANAASDAPIRMVRTNLGKIAFIFWASSSTSDPSTKEGYYADQCCIAWGDVTPLRNITINTHVRMLTVIMPLLTNSQFDVLSKIVKSGFMPYYSDYSTNFRSLLVNDHRFITDGYFAIEDGEIDG